MTRVRYTIPARSQGVRRRVSVYGMDPGVEALVRIGAVVRVACAG